MQINPLKALASLLVAAKASAGFSPCSPQLPFFAGGQALAKNVNSPSLGVQNCLGQGQRQGAKFMRGAELPGVTVGIDLGTTNSAIAVLRDGKPEIVPNKDGGLTTPSTVAFLPGGGVLVGEEAVKQAASNVANTFYAAKRFIGRPMKEVQPYINNVGFSVATNDNGDPLFHSPVLQEPIAPEEVSAQVLQSLIRDAERATGKNVARAVVTVPAYFDQRQRDATRAAAVLAGVTEVQLLPEPVAACLAHRLSGATGLVVVFDLGAGTFDISILKMRESGDVEVKATSGHSKLGGNDFDAKLVHWLAKEAEKLGHPVKGNKEKMRRLADDAEAAKIKLSVLKSAEVPVPTNVDREVSQEDAPTIKLERSTFENLCEPLFLELKKPVLEAALSARVTLPGEVVNKEKMMKKPKKKVRDKLKLNLPEGKKKWFPTGDSIDEVIMVGGATEMSAVRKFIENLFGVQPRRTVDPMQAVALGAAVQAGVLSGEIKDVRVLDSWQSSILELIEELEQDGAEGIEDENIDEEEEEEIDKIMAAWSDDRVIGGAMA